MTNINEGLQRYALEYQEAGGNFHYNPVDSHTPQNTSGYKTISICSFDDCCTFCNSMKEKFTFDKRPYPTFETIKEEWDSKH